MRVDHAFFDDVCEKSSQDLSRCFHCMCCSGGCPVAHGMDYLPNQILRMIQLGLKEEVLTSKAIWLCIGCYACVTECPNRVHIPHMMDALREIALSEGVALGEPDIWAFHREFLKQVTKRGRIYELEFMARYKLATGNLFQDAKMGMRMFRLGRLELLPSSVKHREVMARIREACDE